MKHTKLITALLAAALIVPIAAPAVAQALSPGEIQLAATLGVEPGKYSLSQLAILDELRSEGASAYAAEKFILDNPQGSYAAVTRTGVNFGTGVEPTLPSDIGSLAD